MEMIFEKISRWENSRWENFQSQMKLLNLEEVASRSTRNITEEEHRANWKLLVNARIQKLYEEDEARQKQEKIEEEKAEREAARSEEENCRNEAWRREIDEKYEIWVRQKQVENEETHLQRERLAQEEREKAEMRIMRDKILAWTWTEEEPVQEMELLDEEESEARRFKADEEDKTERETHQIELHSRLEEVEKSRKIPSDTKEDSVKVFRDHKKVELGLPREINQIVLSFLEGRSSEHCFEEGQLNTSNTTAQALATSVEPLKLIGSLLYDNRFPFDPGGHFTKRHFRVRAQVDTNCRLSTSICYIQFLSTI
jgi:hypothetical protein